MKYLFVTVDGAGAIYPQLALAQRLRARGHEVRFLACRSQLGAIERAGLTASSYSGRPDFDMADPNGAIRDWAGDPEPIFRACCDLIWFGPAGDVADDVLQDVRREPVDALVIDYFAFGAAIAAERLGIPAAVLWHTSFGEWPGFNLGLPAINQARVRHGLSEDLDVYESFHRADRILVLTSQRFGSAMGEQWLPPNLRYVGPQLPPGAEPPATQRSPNERRSVLVSLSTSYQAQERVLQLAIAALGELPVNALVTTGPAVTLDEQAPANVEIRPWASHTEVLPQMDLVVTHGGLGTVMTAMAFGVPLVCLPMGRDQHDNAASVSRLGLGTAVDPSAGVHLLREAIRSTLENLSFRARAQELAAECARGNGYDDGAIELEVVAARNPAQLRG